MRNSVVTTEMCSKYHPDKACDQVSDAILTECLRLDPTSKVACETLWKGETVVLAGEITTSAEIDYEKIVREVDFGEPQVDIRTINVSELIITGGNQTPVDGEFAFDPDEIEKALVERRERLDSQKERDMERAKNRGSKAPAKGSAKTNVDVGF